jgi:hypothetical protein
LKDIWRVLPEADEATALKWLKDEQARVRTGVASDEKPRMRFSAFAASLFEHKVKVADIRSAKGRETWRNTLEHLIAGTDGEKAKHHVEGFGEFFVDKIHVTHVEAWKAAQAELIEAGDYSPSTINRWLSVLRVIMKAAKRQLGLTHLATEGVENFDLSEHETYTEAEPNALLPEEVPAFLRGMRDLHPQHYAMTYLGLATGLRPSSLRPLRRSGCGRRCALGEEPHLGSSLPDHRRRGDEHDETEAQIRNRSAAGGLRGPPLARRNAAHHARAKGVRSPLSGDQWWVPSPVRPQQAVR